MEKIWTTTQAADWLGLTDRRVRQLCASGSIEGAQRVGRDWIVSESAVKAYADSMLTRMPKRRRDE